MKIAIPTEHREDETRVSATPETVKKLAALGPEVMVETGAGRRAYFTDEAYREAGARLGGSAQETLAGADVVFKVRAPAAEEIALIPRGASLIGLLEPHGNRVAAERYAAQGVDAFAIELMPRISRAQSMDALSSQANLAGYKAVIDAAALFARAMPMMMTAAGTVASARVLVLGAGVAGLQAIATARRLGAIVSATDVRPAAKEQVESLGGTFLMLETDEITETRGGYAREVSQDYQRRQAQMVSDALARQDIAICTALIPGREAPILITEEMMRRMRPGSIIVDLAVEQGGNCQLSRAGEIVEAHGVRIVGHRNVPGRLPVDASALYARNLLAFLSAFVDRESGALALDWDDELITATALTRAGEVVHPMYTGSPD